MLGLSVGLNAQIRLGDVQIMLGLCSFMDRVTVT